LRVSLTDKRLDLLVDQGSANTIKRIGYKTFTGLCVDTFKALGDSKGEPSIGRASEEEPRAVQPGMKAKGAVNNPSSRAQEKHSGRTWEAKTSDRYNSQFADVGGLVIPKSTTKRVN
jgi:hypothetical protein